MRQAWYIWAKLKTVRPIVAAEIKAHKAAAPILTEAHALRYESQPAGPAPRLTTRSGGINPFAPRPPPADDAEAGLVRHSVPPAGFAPPPQVYDNPYAAHSAATFGGSEVSLHEAPLRHDPYRHGHGADLSREDLSYPTRPSHQADGYDGPSRAPSYRTHAS